MREVSDQSQRTILLVDDEAIIRDLCARTLRDYRILTAADGEEALRLFRQGGVDLVLTDVMMPRMGGIELLDKIKELEPTAVVIIMTGYAEKDVILNALKANADDFIAKPLNLLQLRTAVEKVLVKKALKEEIANLRSMDRLKTNFLSLISHKFRTPITAISLFLQNLGSGVFDPDDPEFRRHTSLIYEEACYLESLVADLLNFSTVMAASDKLTMLSCKPHELVKQALAESREAPRKPEIRLDLTLPELSPLVLDCEKIVFVVRELIDNAFKFTEAGTIRVMLRPMGGGLEIEVKDTGCGIDPADLPKVFEKFYQVDREKSGQVRGFGLGLYYAREFVKLHGGTLVLESIPGAGTRAVITLPSRDGDV
jgi:signal transduction histidine kinase